MALKHLSFFFPLTRHIIRRTHMVELTRLQTAILIGVTHLCLLEVLPEPAPLRLLLLLTAEEFIFDFLPVVLRCSSCATILRVLSP